VEGFFNRLSDGLQACKVEDGLAVEPLQRLTHGPSIPDIGLDPFNGPLSEVPHSVEGTCAGVRKIVEDHDPIPRLQQFNAGVGADIAGAAGDKNGGFLGHGLVILPGSVWRLEEMIANPNGPGNGDTGKRPRSGIRLLWELSRQQRQRMKDFNRPESLFPEACAQMSGTARVAGENDVGPELFGKVNQGRPIAAGLFWDEGVARS
jgi:hypothetical protein